MKQRMNENKNIKNKNSEEIKKRGWGKRRKICGKNTYIKQFKTWNFCEE
jgi:hypothetical protein